MHGGYLQTVGSALKTPRVARSVKHRVGTAAALAETLLERRGPALTRRLTPRERHVELTVATVFVVTAVLMATTADWDKPDTSLLLVACYGLVRRVRFPLGPGLIRPTEVVFVPMLLLTPAAGVPLLVAVGSALGELPELLRKRAHPERLAVTVADGCYSVGPALVVLGLGQGTGALLLALAAQFATDLVVSSVREYFGAGISPAELVPVLALVYLIDALLAPVGYLAVLASENHAYAYLLAIAPAALLGLITRERSARIAHELALERAFRRSTRSLDARAEDLRRQAGRMQRGESSLEDRARLERVLLATTVEALQADAGRLSEVRDDGVLARQAGDRRGAPLAAGRRIRARHAAGERAGDRRRP